MLWPGLWPISCVSSSGPNLPIASLMDFVRLCSSGVGWSIVSLLGYDNPLLFSGSKCWDPLVGSNYGVQAAEPKRPMNLQQVYSASWVLEKFTQFYLLSLFTLVCQVCLLSDLSAKSNLGLGFWWLRVKPSAPIAEMNRKVPPCCPISGVGYPSSNRQKSRTNHPRNTKRSRSLRAFRIFKGRCQTQEQGQSLHRCTGHPENLSWDPRDHFHTSSKTRGRPMKVGGLAGESLRHWCLVICLKDWYLMSLIQDKVCTLTRIITLGGEVLIVDTPCWKAQVACWDNQSTFNGSSSSSSSPSTFITRSCHGLESSLVC